MIRPSTPATLGEYAASYGLFHDVRPATLYQYAIAARLLERWHGSPIPLEQLDERMISAWLQHYAATGVRPTTVRSKKQGILSLWRAAAEEELCRPPARRIRSVRVVREPVEAWLFDEVVRLLAACRGLPRPHPCGLRRAVWWDLAVRIAWDTGLRWGDQITLPVAAVRPDGSGAWCQSKTARPVTFQLSEGTLAALEASLRDCPRELVLPWPASHETFNAQVRRLVRRAGIRRGTWKWLRRSSSSYVELDFPGAGSAHLGHAPGSRIAEQHYFSPAILRRREAVPRPLPFDLEDLAKEEEKIKKGGG